MRLNPFKKDPAKTAKTARLKEARAAAREEMKRIKKIADPLERVKQYEAVNEDLEKHYDSGKPEITSRKSVSDTIGTPAPMAGWTAGTLASAAALSAALPAAGLPVVLAVMMGSAAAGGAGASELASLWRGRKERKRLREEYGSVRNALAMHKLQKKVEKEALKDLKKAGPFELAEKFRAQVSEEKQSAATETVALCRRKSFDAHQAQ